MNQNLYPQCSAKLAHTMNQIPAKEKKLPFSNPKGNSLGKHLIGCENNNKDAKGPSEVQKKQHFLLTTVNFLSHKSLTVQYRLTKK